jgi:putative acetyltransferase
VPPADCDLPTGIRIRPERAGDPAEVTAIGVLHDAAFDDPQVAPLVEAIRASPEYLPGLSLVAEAADAPDSPIVGHIMISTTELTVDEPEQPSIPILMLSPLGVRPDRQGSGIGIALTRAALTRADARPEPIVIVQGHPGYYPRFGFVPGRTIGILPPEHLGAIDQAWMVRLRPPSGDEQRPPVRGRVVYPQAFLDLD